MSSLRRRLLLTLLAGLVFGGLTGGIGLYWQSIEELDELFDDRLQDIGNNLSDQALAQYRPILPDEPDDDIVIQHWSGDHRLLYRSSDRLLAPAPQDQGLADLSDAAHNWRSYSRRTPDGGLLQVAQELVARREIAAESATRLLLPLLGMIPLIALFSAWAVSRQLQPLRSLADQVGSRDALSRSTIHVAQAPSELRPVIHALNELLARQAEALQRQQAFLADAAHELRTPMALLHLQVQRAEQTTEPAQHAAALIALRSGVDRATRLVNQLLALARSEPLSATGQRNPVALDNLVKSVVGDLYPLALHKELDLGVTHADPSSLPGDIEGLHSLLTNLVDNAIRYTPPRGRIDVSLHRLDHALRLEVTDTGPGIPAAMRPRMFERFVRGDSGDSLGTGLGLAIARQVVDAHGGSITLEAGDNGRGLRVMVILPLAA